MLRFMGRSVVIATLLALACACVLAQDKGRGSLSCRENNNWYGDRLVGNCEIREQTLQPGGAISIDGRQNGGVAVKGWDQSQVWCVLKCKLAHPTRAKPNSWADKFESRPQE